MSQPDSPEMAAANHFLKLVHLPDIKVRKLVSNFFEGLLTRRWAPNSLSFWCCGRPASRLLGLHLVWFTYRKLLLLLRRILCCLLIWLFLVLIFNQSRLTLLNLLGGFLFLLLSLGIFLRVLRSLFILCLFFLRLFSSVILPTDKLL